MELYFSRDKGLVVNTILLHKFSLLQLLLIRIIVLFNCLFRIIAHAQLAQSYLELIDHKINSTT